MRGVSEIEHFRAKLEFGAFRRPCQVEVLEYAQIGIHQARTEKDVSPRISVSEILRVREGGNVEPLLQRRIGKAPTSKPVRPLGPSPSCVRVIMADSQIKRLSRDRGEDVGHAPSSGDIAHQR